MGFSQSTDIISVRVATTTNPSAGTHSLKDVVTFPDWMNTPTMKSGLVSLVLLCTLCTTVFAQLSSSGIEAASSTQGVPSNTASRPHEGEGLPPDTFRKLAQALYQRGDKVQNRLQRKYFYNDNVTCNDGSTAGYYIRRNYQSKKWIVFLEGGWICYDEKSCMQRASREPHRVSSDHWAPVKSVGGILSSDPEENPHFANANHVFVPYCSSDSWSGTRKGTKESPAFLGHFIVKEVIQELSEYHQLLHGEELILIGSSAGGTGVLLNVDYVAKSLAPVGIQVRGIVDSGWFLDNDPFAPNRNGGSGKYSVIQDLQKGVKLWQAAVQNDCSQLYGDEEHKCFFGYIVHPFIKAPLFIFQWQFDIFQLHANNVDIPASRDQWNYIHKMGKNLRSSLSTAHAVFSPACIAHEIFTKSQWSNVSVDGISLPDAVNCWSQTLPSDKSSIQVTSQEFQDLQSYSQIKEDYYQRQETPQNHGGNYMFQRSQQLLSRSASMLADAPHSQFKLAASNLVRSMSTTSGENARNSLGNYRESRKNVKINDNRTNRDPEEYHRLKNRRRERRRCRKHPEKCRTDNSDLVRSLDRRSNRKEKKNGEGRTSREERQKKRERRMRRRREKKAKKAEKRKQRRLRRQQKLQRKRLRQLQQSGISHDPSKAASYPESGPEPLSPRSSHSYDEERESLGHGKHHLKVRSVRSTPSPPESHSSSSADRTSKEQEEDQQSNCPLRLVDSCSFPHCNPSCPALLNPETGQEIDFLTLLKSFGMDISSMATALNVDISVLQDMDREVIISLLTSRPPN